MACKSKTIALEDFGHELSPYPKSWFRSFGPSPLDDSVWEIGVLKSDAVKRVTGLKGYKKLKELESKSDIVRRVYALIAKSEVKALDPLDPVTMGGALLTSMAISEFTLWAPQSSSTNWGNCADSQYESCSLTSAPSTLTYAYSYYPSNAWGPYLFIYNSTVTGTPLPTNTTPTAYALPCPLSSPATLTNVLTMNGKVLLRAWVCQNSSSSLYYTRYSAQDSSTNSYTIAAAGLGLINGGTPSANFIYNLSSTYTKGSTDIYYYIYEIDVGYS